MRINNNLMALNTYNQLTTNGQQTSKSIEKLSSGLRINSAADDAAGLAISEKMRSQIRGLDQASRNAQDGISLVQTAEGALEETEAILQRMRELSVQAVNDTYTDEDRVAMQDEIEQLVAEIDRISTDTEFNNKSLLDGSVDIETSMPGATNLAGIETSKVVDDGMEDGTYTVTVTSAPVIDYTVKESGDPTNAGAVTAGATDIAPGTYTLVSEATGNANEYNVYLQDENGDKVGVTDTVVAGTDVNIDLGVANVVMDGTFEAGESEIIVDATFDIKVEDGAGNLIESKTITDDTTGKIEVGGFELEYDNGITNSTTDISVQSDAIKLQIGANSSQTTSIAISEMSADSLDIENVDLSTSDSAENSIDAIEAAISKVSSERSKLGAMQNRLEHTINNLTTSSENLTAAESGIRDVDMAKEMMEFTKSNILQQSAQSMLSQANQQPEQVLQLLR